MKPLDQNECLVSLLKDRIYICLEPEGQEPGMTFICTLGGQSTLKALNKMQIDSESLSLTVYLVQIIWFLGLTILYSRSGIVRNPYQK